MNKKKTIEEGFLFPMDEPDLSERTASAAPVQAPTKPTSSHLRKDGKVDRRCKPAVYEPRPALTIDEMREYLIGLKEIESATGIRYVKLRVTARMIIGIREASGKEFTINLDELFQAYHKCLRFTSPEVKKYIFMGHSPAVALLRLLQKRHKAE